MAGSDAIKVGEGNIVLGMDLGPLANDLKAAQAKIQAWGQGVMAAGAGIGAIGAAITAPFLYGLSVFSDMGSDIVKTSRMTNMSFGEVQAAMAGTKLSADELTTATKRMDMFISSAAEGSPEAVHQLQMMGLTIGDLANLTEYERLLLFADGIQKIGDASQRSTAQVKVFGRSGLEANLVGGAAGVRKRAARGAEVGGLLSDADVKLAKEYAISQKELALATKGLWAQIGAAAAPLMTWFTNTVTNIIIAVRKWVEQNRGLLTTIFHIGDKLVLAGVVIGGFGAAIFGLGTAFGLLAYVVASLGVVVAAVFSPIGLIIAGVAATVVLSGYLIYKVFEAFPDLAEQIGSYFVAWGPIIEQFGQTFMQTWGGISDAIFSGDLRAAMEIACLGMELVWTRMINYIAGTISDISYLLVTNFQEAMNVIITGMNVARRMVPGLALAPDIPLLSLEQDARAIAMDQRIAALREEQGIQDQLDYAVLEAYYTRLFSQRPITGEPGIPGGDLAGKQGSSTGTFSASAIAGMIGGTDPIDKLRVVAEQQLDVQRDQLRAIENAFEWA